MKTLAFGLSLAALAACGVAFAQQAAQHDHAAGRPAAGPVTKAQAQEMAGAMFDRMDANKDGKVDASDREARRTEMKAAMFQRMDANNDGQISRDEFMAFKPGGPGGGMGGHGMHGPMGGHGMGRGMGGMIMRMADGNGDGTVTREEYMAAFSKHFDEVDANHDGTITPEERRAAHRAMHRRMHDHMGGHGMGGPGGATPPPPKSN